MKVPKCKACGEIAFTDIDGAGDASNIPTKYRLAINLRASADNCLVLQGLFENEWLTMPTVEIS